jgi:hypothetical protein
MTLQTLASCWAIRWPIAASNPSSNPYGSMGLRGWPRRRRGADSVDVAVPLQMMLSLEGVRCRPKA